MKAVYKYEFAVNDDVRVQMPHGAKVLSVGSQKTNHICVWALVHPENPLVSHFFRVCGTGHPITPEDGICAEGFVGTVFDGPFAWHVFQTKD